MSISSWCILGCLARHFEVCNFQIRIQYNLLFREGMTAFLALSLLLDISMIVNATSQTKWHVDPMLGLLNKH